MSELILAGTGHRPDKLGGYSDAVFLRLVALAERAIERYRPTHIISGMALGWDQALARAASYQKVPWTAAVPFKGQEGAWPPGSREIYLTLLAEASRVKYVCDPGYAAWKMQKRNEWMVDHSHGLLALWDGSPGGTGNCIEYARARGVTIHNVWSSWVRYKDMATVVK